MEDYLAVQLSPHDNFSKLPHLREQAYVGVFDGHGGKEAAKYARDRLWEIIQNQPKYSLSDINSVKESLEDAYVALHEEMEPLRGTEIRLASGMQLEGKEWEVSLQFALSVVIVFPLVVAWLSGWPK